MLYLGWIVAGFLGSLLLALTLWRHEKRRSLRTYIAHSTPTVA